MIYQWDSNTQTATVTTEHTLTSMDWYGEAIQLIVDLSAMANGDVLELRVYQKVLTGGTSRVVGLYTFYGAQPADALIFNSDKFMNEISSEEGLNFTLKQTFGTGRAYPWKVLYAVTDHSTVWETLTSGFTTVGSIGKLIADNLNATVSSRSTLDAAGIRSAIGLASANLDTQLAAISAFIDTEVAAILAAVDTEVAAIKAKTDQLTFTIANKVDSSIQAAGDFAQAAADKVWSTAARTLTAFGFSVNLASGQLFIKKNTALSNFTFLMRQSSDHITPATGLTITATRSIDGAAFAACANAASEIGNGVYKIDLAAADLNGTVITLKFTAAGADQRTITLITQT